MTASTVGITYDNGTITLDGATRTRLEAAARAVNMDAESFIEAALDSTMQSAVESVD